MALSYSYCQLLRGAYKGDHMQNEVKYIAVMSRNWKTADAKV